MNQEIQGFGITSNLESDYVPFISFKTQQQQSIAEQYVFNKAEVLLNDVLKLGINVKKSYLSSLNLISDKDFRQKPIKYFYENIFADLQKRDAKNRLVFMPRWGICFDIKCTPISIKYLSPSFNVYRDSRINFYPFDCKRYFNYDECLQYGTIDINKKPAFYYIYFTLQEIINEIKK
jgi:hypothetical protein